VASDRHVDQTHGAGSRARRLCPASARWAEVAFIYWQIRLPVRRQRHSIVDYFDQLSINRTSFYILKHYEHAKEETGSLLTK